MPGISNVSLVAGNQKTLPTLKLGVGVFYSKGSESLVNEGGSDI